ncbi:hypothetical protein RND81_04G083200 [Saponaria officinalis]|uniref:SWIM-type domain-containing protein n=1 Tax=Saponaria officinalis TaxID=3572 RepID=A0AAW1LJ32_SAPOF
MTSNAIPSTPLARPPTVEKHTPPILLSYSPKGCQQWIRKVEQEFIPRIGMELDTLEDGKYVICQFREGQNHRHVLVKNREFQKLSRNLTLYQKQIIINHSKINIGASKTYRICKEVSNGYENVDAHGKSAYLAFSDGASFDPTYGINKYFMFFTPFTGIDNHKKSVTFACALLSNEDEESFVWVADKIDIITRKETDFLSRLNGVVWNQDLEPKELEDKWNERHTHKRLEMESNNSIPKTISPLSLESHALTVYTHEVFYEIQEEIKSSMCSCGIVGYSRSASVEITTIEDSQRNKTFGVQYNALTSDVLCTCKLFERRWLICRHIFWVFSNKLLKTIPEKYILPRWSKNALRGPIYDLNGNIIENYDTADESQLEMSKVWSEFYNVISVVAKRRMLTPNEWRTMTVEIVKNYLLSIHPKKRRALIVNVLISKAY